ncbi:MULTISPECIES: hypothetical protein [unclassified Bacillus (in: firmicutes)]|uniref:hypothetical protein n=1 Tax=unclassified Bacillus (in: firmicutes) TaxID=185979 RepID=UPI0020C8A12D|nr:MULTISPECIES: hypothetical protein [unclassified Bacillus (in: firmicutes)]
MTFDLSSAPQPLDGEHDDFGKRPMMEMGGGSLDERFHHPDGSHEGGGRGGQFESVNPIAVIIAHLGLMSVFIIGIYYMEKLIIRWKRRKKISNEKIVGTVEPTQS